MWMQRRLSAKKPLEPSVGFWQVTMPSFFPTCQVRVVRFYVSRLLPPPSAFRRLPPPPDLNHDHPRQAFPAGPQPQESTPSVPCRTSTARIHAMFPAGPQPRPSTPSVPCRTSTATIHAQCSLPDLNRENPRQSVSCRTSTAGENAKRYAR